MNHSAAKNAAREEIAKRLARVTGHANSLKRLWEGEKGISYAPLDF